MLYPWLGSVMPGSVVPYWYLRTGFFEYVQSFTHVLQIGVDVSASDDDGQPVGRPAGRSNGFCFFHNTISLFGTQDTCRTQDSGIHRTIT